jgi:putative colanic acid biosynthesis acetyltransferase WcaF
MNKVDLSKYDNSWYRPGGGFIRIGWYFVNAVCFNTWLILPNGLKLILLKLFGAKIGNSITIKPNVNIKYPWFLELGSNVWLGEGCWLDSLAKIKIGSNVSISQGALLLTGNHDYTKTSFELKIAPITLEDGAWIGAKALICPGVTIGSHSVICAGSVVTKDTRPYMVYQGNPAVALRERTITE